jgi:nucleoside-diphosphate-sugar epimerase
VLVAGATGVIGARVVRRLVAAGHTVAGITRTHENAAVLEAADVHAYVCDVFDRAALRDAVVAFAPDIVVHELTDLPDDVEDLPVKRNDNARIRVEGTRNLVDAALEAGATRVIAQSVAWTMPPGAGADAVATLERTVLELNDHGQNGQVIDGLVLRYGQLYGPDTFYPDDLPAHPRVHVDEAARRTVALLDGVTGVETIVEAEG